MKTKHLMIPALLVAVFASAPSFAQDRDHGGDRTQGWSQGDRNQTVNQGERNQNTNQGERSQNWNQQGERNQNWNQGNRDQRWNRGERDHGDRGDRHDGYQARGGGRGGDEGYGGEHRWDGAGPEHSWHRGDRLPSNYRSRQYVVDDWRGHHLRRPPRGYHWVQSGGDYVLAAVATGVIADLIINSH